MVSCTQFHEMISAFIDGELDEEQEAVLRAHMESCLSCKNVYAVFSSLSEAIGGELDAPPDSLKQGIMFRLSAEEQRKKPRRSRLAGITAAAACLALILLGASHFGLTDGLGFSQGSSATPPETEIAESMELYQASEPAEAQDQAVGMTESKDSGSAALTDVLPQETAMPEEGNEETALLQFGFSLQNTGGENEMSLQSGVQEPAFLFEAGELKIYEGSFFAAEAAAEKNKLLFTLSAEEDKAAVYALVTALPDETVDYTAEDAVNLKSEPAYTVFVPANKNTKDRLISIWFVDKSVWCVISEADEQTEGEKIIYKAEGALDKFEELLARLNSAT